MLDNIQRKIIFWQHPAASSKELILDRQRVYILPSKAGLIYGLMLLSIFITAINYGLNLGYALDFILISCAWLGILLTFRNLAGLGLDASGSPAVFSGELAHFSVHLNNHSKRARYAIAIGFDKSSMQMVDIPEHSSHSMTLATQTTQRGWMPCPRIRLQTSFPFGLLNAWSYWKTTQKILVYPAPELNPPPLPYAAMSASGHELTAGQDEFSGVRNYQVGDSLKQLAWRQMARQSAGGNEVLLSKHFEGGLKKICVLDFDDLPLQFGAEQKLSRLCAWLLKAEQEQVSYAFKLGAEQFALNSGEDHQRCCLTALALFGIGENR
ncbi:DUF58 domain-containing protein [Solimicrobium silvestre]|uniref:Uncharacterized protein n=1 Tax=Solimicrobium silvestre TaxID=2099400 RepID=A0A2S9GXU6_9BURK|nr:DUF58 domain-containing protein [Solimicrobium silvestre]PRC92542.1 hypothetical protein S2091_2597 [Solimicrobium silvestre]